MIKAKLTAEETTRVEQTNNSWHIDNCLGAFDNDLKWNGNVDNDTDNDDGNDWKDNICGAWSLVLPALTFIKQFPL